MQQADRRPRNGDLFDAVFVGSGINGLVGAATLAKRGWRVAVLERAEHLGGAMCTVDTKGGFRTELMSCFHLQFLGSPAYQYLSADLERHGLRYANTDEPFAVVTDDGRSLLMTTDHARNIERLERLQPGQGKAWDAAIGALFAGAEDLLGIRNLHPLSPAGLRWMWGVYRRRGGAGTRALLAEMLMSARTWLGETFEEPLIHALLAPWALHGASSPDELGSAVTVRAVAAFCEAMGQPVPVGGGRAVAAALAAIIEEHGGVCLTGVDVDRVIVQQGKAVGVAAGDRVFDARRAVACSVTAAQLYELLLDGVSVPNELRASARKVRPGPAVFQMAYSLDRPLRWAVDDDLSRTAVVNITGGLDAVSRAANEGRRGLLPAESTICCGQPMALDDTRGPVGGSQLWIQVLDLPSVPIGDAVGEIAVTDGWTVDVREAYADRIQRRLARHLPGLEDSIIERIAVSPADLEVANINLVGGSCTSGAPDLDQMLVLRPSPYALAPRTPVKRLYHIGASTHPGASLAAGSGFLLAKKLAKIRRA
ncbi:NAD(P)/FAD-dependent oxidoreductase [Streptomyces sp. NPDC047072]|uniref:phytoene desaturase family protein n=1 Tax=Streptomyces sp. NPDC047072 TaxID=3154809 RepID=UPI0033E9F365